MTEDLQVSEMNFDEDKLIEIPVSINHKKFILREANGEVAGKWRGSIVKHAIFDKGKAKQVGAGVAESDCFLVSLCLFEVIAGEKETSYIPAKLDFVKRLRARTIKALFEKAKEIAELNEEEEEEETLETLLLQKDELEKKIAEYGESELKKEPANSGGGSG